MKKSILYCITLLLLMLRPGIVQSQDLIYSWIQQAGGQSFDLATDMAIDNEDNLYITGIFENKSSFSTKELVSSGSFDIFLAKYDKTGKLIWLKKFGGKNSDKAESIVLDSKGNIYISGRFKGECNFGKKTVTAKGFMDGFIIKFKPDGEIEWLNTFPADTKAEKGILAINNNDSLYYASSFYKTIKLGNIMQSATSGSDIVIAALDKDGNFIKATFINGNKQEKLQDMAFDNNNDLYITGSFSGTMEIDKHVLNSNGKQDIFLAKFKDLKASWLRQAGGSYTDYASKVTIAGDIIVLSGSFTGMATYGPFSLLSEGLLDAFVCSYNKQGKVLWARGFGGKANEYTNSVLKAPDGSIYISGSYRGKIQAGEDEIKSKDFSKDIFLTKFSKEGKLLWTKSLGGAKNDFAVNMLKGNDNYFYQIGSFSKNLTIDRQKAMTIGKANDFFISRFYDCDISPKIELGNDRTLCAGTDLTVKGEYISYLWNTGETESSIPITESGIYSVTVTDKYSCSSSDEIDISVKEAPIVNLGTDTVVGLNKTIVLKTDGEYHSYFWSDSTTKKTLVLPPVNMDKTKQITLTVGNENNCFATDSILLMWRTGSKENDYLNKIGNNNPVYSVFPNPTDGKFTILAEKPGTIKQIEIFDLSGNKIKIYINIADFPIEADLSNQPKGTYLVIITETNGSYQYKVVVE